MAVIKSDKAWVKIDQNLGKNHQRGLDNSIDRQFLLNLQWN